MLRQLIIIITLLLSFFVHAQTQLSGTVSDSKGRNIPGANVYLKDSYDGSSTNSEGAFRFSSTLEGSQTLVISAMGYHTHEQAVDCDQANIRLNIKLRETISQLNAVNITAGSMEASDEKRSVVVKPLDIVTTSGALGDVVGALSTLPGTSTIGNDGRLFVRGGDATETAIFFDGLKVGNAYGTSTSGVPTRTRFSPLLFKGTFFSTGGYSAEFGQALSSALVLNTVDMPVRTQTDISLMTVGGSLGHTQSGKKSSGTISLSYFDLAPYQSLVPQDFDWERAPSSLNAEGQYRHKWGKDGLLKAFYSHQQSGLDLWQKVPGQNDRGQHIKITNNYDFVNLSARKKTGDKWLLEGGSSLSNNLDVLNIDTLQLERHQRLAHFKAKYTYFHNDRFNWVNGAEHFIQYYREAQPEQNHHRSLQGNLSAAFTEANYYFSSDWAARVGARAEYDDLNQRFYLSPRLSAAYKLDERSQFSVAYGSFNQDAEDQYRVQDRQLNHTRAQHYIVNYLFAKEGYTLRAEAFHKEYGQLVVNGTGGDFTNDGYGYARGVDVFYRDRKTLKNTDYWITYSWVQSQRRYGSFSQAVQPSFAPEHNLSVVAKHFVSSLKSQIGGSWSWNSGLPYDNPNKVGEQESVSPNFSNLSLSWSYLHRQNIILHAAVTNVLGRDNLFGYRYSEQPDANGNYASLPMIQGAKHFFFIGLFITISEDKSANQLNNL